MHCTVTHSPILDINKYMDWLNPTVALSTNVYTKQIEYSITQ